MRTVFHLAAALSAVISVSAPTPSFQVKVTGHGPAMILIRGLSSSGDTWTSTVEHYLSEVLRVRSAVAHGFAIPHTVDPQSVLDVLNKTARELVEEARNPPEPPA